MVCGGFTALPINTKNMKTKQVDLEIERLTILKKRSELSDNGVELLTELISLKNLIVANSP